ncbi:DNA-binding domain-containing protein [Gluconobacter cerinus]|uniref:DNA-binding domain-containing protein n=1 Tax=Gluconobacter cerinus TaxID=38307 RepID=UPI0038D033F0
MIASSPRMTRGCVRVARFAPHWCTSASVVSECPQEAWDILLADYLRLEAPRFAACYRRPEKVAEQQDTVEPDEAVSGGASGSGPCV